MRNLNCFSMPPLRGSNLLFVFPIRYRSYGAFFNYFRKFYSISPLRGLTFLFRISYSMPPLRGLTFLFRISYSISPLRGLTFLFRISYSISPRWGLHQSSIVNRQFPIIFLCRSYGAYFFFFVRPIRYCPDGATELFPCYEAPAS